MYIGTECHCQHPVPWWALRHNLRVRPKPAAKAVKRVKTRASGPARPSLQLRKQDLVREELSRAAWELFGKKGYESTTVAEIARTAGVSRRTFFRYYASKDDVVIETSDELAEDFLGAVARRPAKESPLVAIQRALVPALERRLARAEESRAIIRLLRESRSLRRAMLERHARMEERLAAQLAGRLGIDPSTNSKPALLAFLARAMMDTAFNVWYDQHRKDVPELVDELFAKLRDLTRQR
jgi:AcrR family transcriptional regulator